MRVDELPDYVNKELQSIFEEKVKQTTWIDQWGHWDLVDCMKMFYDRGDEHCERIYKVLRDYQKTI